MIALHLALSLLPGGSLLGSLSGGGQVPEVRSQEGSTTRNRLPEGFVRYSRVPEGGLYPRIGYGKGELAVLYFKGEADHGDLFVARSSDEAQTFSSSQRANAEPGTVASVDGTHCGALDLGSDGTIHVLWTTSGEPRSLRYVAIPKGGEPGPVVDLGSPPGLCASAAITIDREGRILVFYAAVETPEQLEATPPLRQVWMRVSTDGKQFADPVSIDRKEKGVSDHSGMAAHVDEVMGTVFVLYRTAYLLQPGTPSLSRGMRLLHSTDGQTFEASWVDNWKGVRDPHSRADLSQEENSTLTVWESGGQVYWAMIRRQVKKLNIPADPKVEGEPVYRTRPAGAAGGGEVMLAWLERPQEAQNSEPIVAWSVWYREGRGLIQQGRAPEAPLSGTPAVLPRAHGGFTVLY